jgi:hypothetical protein
VRLRSRSDGSELDSPAVRLTLLVSVFVVVAAGCGGSHKKSASTTTTFATSKNCAQLMALGTKLAQALQAPSGSAETRIRKEAKLLQGFADAAPSDVRGDFQTLASAFNAYTRALLKAMPNPGTPPTAAQVAQMRAAAKVFDTPKLRAAEQHLTAWAQKNCGAMAPTASG